MSTVDELLAGDHSLLLVDDDKTFLTRLERAMQKRGFDVRIADTVAGGLAAVEEAPPAFAVVDLRLEDGNGLDVVAALHKKREDARAVVLTGYGNIATAVTAVKLGAVDYLSKPADAEDVINALLANTGAAAGAAGEPDVGRPGALGAHPARLRALRPQRVGNGAAAQHAPPHPAAHPRQARAQVDFAMALKAPSPGLRPTSPPRERWTCGTISPPHFTSPFGGEVAAQRRVRGPSHCTR